MKRLELQRELRNERVDFEVRPPLKRLLTEGTPADRCVVPVGREAGHAEVVSARGGNGPTEHVQADRTEKLILGQEAAAGGHV